MAMSRKDYRAIAEIISADRKEARDILDTGDERILAYGMLISTRNVARAIADYAKEDNDRFREDVFFSACGIANSENETGEAD